MGGLHDYLDPRLPRELEGLKLRARRMVEGPLSGLHRGPYRGFSIEFAEHREYAPGDDFRYLDWKVFARTDKFYLKQFEQETNLICYLALDVSQSMSYQGPQAAESKLLYARRAAAALAYVVLRQGDFVGAIAFDEQLRGAARPGGAADHLRVVCELLESRQPIHRTDSRRCFELLGHRLPRRGVVVVLSDFFDDVDRVVGGLRLLRRRRHEVIAMHVLDPAEFSFPFQGRVEFRGLEGWGNRTVEAEAVREAYRREFDAHCDRLRRGCRAHGIDYVVLRTDQPLGRTLSRFLAGRSGRTAAS